MSVQELALVVKEVCEGVQVLRAILSEDGEMRGLEEGEKVLILQDVRGTELVNLLAEVGEGE